MKRFAALALLVPLSLAPVAAGRTPVKTVGVGETWLVASTTHLSRLTLAAGGAIVAPAGDVLTLTVDGVEQGSKLTATGATTTAIVPGTYRGDVVVSVTEANDVTFGGLTFPIRQALYVGASGSTSPNRSPPRFAAGRSSRPGRRSTACTSTAPPTRCATRGSP